MPWQQKIEEEKKWTGHLRVYMIELAKPEAFMTAKVDDLTMLRKQMDEQMCRVKGRSTRPRINRIYISDQFHLEDLLHFE